jgi:arsenate reductase (glutaredoxin)
MKARIYHNPRCSKSRAALALLQERGADVDIVEYLIDPPPQATLERLLGKLGMQARDLVRTGESDFKESGLSLDSPAAQLIDLMVRHPKVIERPIVEVGEHARIGRPPERVLDLLE